MRLARLLAYCAYGKSSSSDDGAKLKCLAFLTAIFFEADDVNILEALVANIKAGSNSNSLTYSVEAAAVDPSPKKIINHTIQKNTHKCLLVPPPPSALSSAFTLISDPNVINHS
jgi:hypothetical protein